MATKASVILIAVFLLTLPVLAGRTTPPATPAPVAVVQVDEATPEFVATTEATETALVGDPVRGEDIFRHGLNDAPPCVTCHNPTVAGKAGFAIGPGLKGIGERGAARVDGLTAPEYIEDSIRHPGSFLVPGFNPIMYGLFGEQYSDQDIADVVAYLLML